LLVKVSSSSLLCATSPQLYYCASFAIKLPESNGASSFDGAELTNPGASAFVCTRSSEGSILPVMKSNSIAAIMCVVLLHLCIAERS